VLKGGVRSVYAVSWGAGPNLGWVAAAGDDGVVRMWELEVPFAYTYFIPTLFKILL
jgi:hypothetical protein